VAKVSQVKDLKSLLCSSMSRSSTWSGVSGTQSPCFSAGHFGE
jgi:hypothetical protein